MPTRHTAAVTFGTSGITLPLVSYDPNERSVESYEEPHLGLAAGSGMPKSPSEIEDNGEYAFHFENDIDSDLSLRVKETITITKPVASGNTNGATEAFTGFISSISEDSMETGTRNLLNVVVTVDGDITFTAGT